MLQINGFEKASIIHKHRRWLILGLFRDLPQPFIVFVYIFRTPATHSVYIDFNMAKTGLSHLSDPLCMQFHLSYTSRISYLHTNVLCSLFHNVLMAKFSTHCIGVKYGKSITSIQTPQRRRKMSVTTNTVFSFRKTVVVLLSCPKEQFSITHSSTIPMCE